MLELFISESFNCNLFSMSSSDTSISNSFVNIDLDEVNANQSLDDSNEDKSSLNEYDAGKDDQITPSVESEKQTENNEHNHKETNEVLERLTKQLMDDYYKYYHLNPSSQLDELNECIENLLTHMEEFYGLIEMIRSDSSLCLEQLSASVNSKVEQCSQLFRMIDKLERIVRHVSLQLSLMEREVGKAEKMMGKNNPVKKLFSLISNPLGNNNSNRFNYVPPDIFKTEDIMKL